MKKNRRILIIAGVVCILAAVLAGAYWNTRQEPGSLQLSEVDASRPLAEFHGQPVHVTPHVQSCCGRTIESTDSGRKPDRNPAKHGFI